MRQRFNETISPEVACLHCGADMGRIYLEAVSSGEVPRSRVICPGCGKHWHISGILDVIVEEAEDARA